MRCINTSIIILTIITNINITPISSTSSNSFVSSFLEESGDTSCLSISKHDKCKNTIDTNGINCKWCKSTKLPWLTACLSEYDEVMLPHGIAHCEGNHNTNTNSENDVRSSVPDLKCVAHTKRNDCNAGVDSVGASCAWCESPTLPFLKVCMTNEEMKVLPAGAFKCGHTTTSNHEYDQDISNIENKLPDTRCIQHSDKDTCISSVDVSGWRCAWCKCDTLSWLSTCVSQKEGVQFPKSLYDCNHDTDRQKERENFIK